jgi:acetyl esterase/lipase
MYKKCLFVAILFWSIDVLAQPTTRISVEAPELKDEILLSSDSSAISEEVWLIDESMYQVRNVTQATLLPFIPKVKRSDAAVIVAPGGAFLGLAIEKEGWKVAQFLADNGVTAFVLKYRLVPTVADQSTFIDQMTAAMKGKPSPVNIPEDTPEFAVNDGLEALRYLRNNAEHYGLNTSQIGFMGFSAGGFLTRSVVEHGGKDKPNFVAPIYPNMKWLDVPDDAPPMFVVIAADDFLLDMAPDFGLIQSYRLANRPIEMHLLSEGGHGFGLGQKNPASRDWPTLMLKWMDRLHLFNNE